ncbi:MAG: hypothetical protein ABR543_05280 [Gemmatimonadaceae bacterium]
MSTLVPRPDWFFGDVVSHHEGESVRLTHAVERAELIVAAGRLRRGTGYASASASARRSLARVGAMLRLRSLGRHLVHASGVVDPVGRAWILAGDSGSGKSTLAYALSRAGWSVLGDDGVVLDPAGDGLTVYGWNDPLRLSTSLSSHFSELGRFGSLARSGDARGRYPMMVRTALAAPVAAIVFLAQAGQDSCVRLAPCTALALLVRQSPWVFLNDGHSRCHLAALGRIVSLAPAFRLEHSPAQLHAIGGTLMETLQ